ncbi:MAG: hypothetical protein KatS3mg111_0554 [Pirellulaceae bacterium]|nr:MAG: hypothetical protein KatS3mg111_0554 [Pirellulaceae bacterium]
MLGRIFATVVGWLVVVVGHHAAAQYHPEHPRVQQMVDQGIKYLRDPANQNANVYPIGEPILVGYTVYKVTGEAEDPLVVRGLRVAQDLANSLPNWREQGESKVVYEASIAAVMLATVDAKKYEPELGLILDFLQRIQKPHGGFGYLAKPTGDTSQTQYVMLAMWTLDQVGVPVPFDSVEATIRYLRATMDPSGGWGYQGKIGVGRLVQQDTVTKSLATAGAGALLIGADILGLFGKRRRMGEEDEGIPEAFVRVDLLDKQQRKRIELTRADIEGPLSLALRYQQQHARFAGGYWYYYWRYSQERFESFLEIVNGKQEKSPAWYNEGVEDLAKRQNDEGGWSAETMSPANINTAFAILFLIRSTQKAIGKIDEGLAFGGYGLPTDISNVRLMGNRIVSEAETSVQNLLEMLEKDEASNIQVSLVPDHLKLSDDPQERQAQVARLSRLLVSGNYAARRVAAKLLGRSDDIAVAPDLIFALTDPDPMVPKIAEESLRLLSRKLLVRHFGDEPPTYQQRADAVDFWKRWYLGLQPDYVFIDRTP